MKDLDETSSRFSFVSSLIIFSLIRFSSDNIFFHLQYSIFGSILTVGAIIGALTCGHTADSAGRKGVRIKDDSFLIVDNYTLANAAGLVAVAGHGICIHYMHTRMDCNLHSSRCSSTRFWTIYGIGNISYVVPVYVAEITPKDLRGLLATLNLLLVVTGLAVAYAIGACVSWRKLALTGLFFIPESPRWLAMVGRQREFEAALIKLRGRVLIFLQSRLTLKYLLHHNLIDSLAIIRQLPKITIPDLLSGRNIRLISTAVVLMTFQQLVEINGINYYAAEIFKSAGVSPSMGSILYSSTQVVVTAIGATLMDRAWQKTPFNGFYFRAIHWQPVDWKFLPFEGLHCLLFDGDGYDSWGSNV
ncbi:hypothetical protein Dsin_023798 [Dipteronia sinensis]|uniref:Major facilitator superfamily (MFS) profile domain-containing protein n=1 Tax=Dipteronia sinensis TaxID=43782 RepID=A0AAE0A401_9ROSI|nr:hypothetical protein Dsin_023798 [Dipteronia sinensis]